MPLSPGESLGSYQIAGVLGAGGMGEVWRATDTRLDRPVALKVLPAELLDDAERAARFTREAKVLATLQHPAIAGVYGFETIEGRSVLAMELVDGEGLDERIARGPIPVDEALAIARQIAEALEAAHEKGIVHRDLKPANVKLTRGGDVKLLDFGLAKALEGTASAETRAELTQSPTLTAHATQAGVILGTAAYMSPEQARGRAVDKRADIWALGVTLYEMLTGRRLFEGETVTDVLAAVLRKEIDLVALPTEAPPGVAHLLRRCLERDPKQRLHDAGDARLEIEEILRAPAARAASAEAPRAGRAGRRLPWAVAAAFAALAALGLRRPPAPAPQVVHLSLTPPPGVVPEAEIVTQTQLLAMSSDGRRVAFRGRKGEDARLYVRDLARESAEPVPGTEGGEQPFFSPDGEWLGFFANGKLRKTAVRGGTPVVLTDISAPRGAAWGPDGTIVYTPSYGSALMRIPGDGGEPKPLTTLDAGTRERTHRWPEVLPDGDTVLFTVGTEDKPGDYDDSRIEAVSLATGKRRVVWSGASVARFAPPDHLLIARHGDLLSVDFDARSGRARGTPSPVLQGVSGDSRSGVAYFGVARNGTLVYATGLSPQGRNEIVWVDRQGRRTPTGIPPGVYSKVALSPDGTKVAYGEGPSGGARSDVWVADLVHGGQLQLTSDGRANSPAWSPDGKQIYCSTPQGDAVVRLSADGTAAPEVVWKSPFRVPIRMDSVTPDGSTLFVTLNGLPTLADIYRIPLRGGGTPGPFIATPGSDIAGMISPNGRWIAYSAEAGIGSVLGQIFVQPYPSLAGRWQVSRSGGSSPIWSRDGTELFFMGPKGELWSAPVRLEPTFAPGEPKPVVKLELPGSTEWGDVYDVAPDARRFLSLAAYREDASAPRIDVILGFTARLTR